MEKPLIPVFPASANVAAGPQLCNARDLHAFLLVRRDFSTWIKRRIDEYGFVKGADYVVAEVLSSPKSVSAKARKQTMIDYHLTLDMAKELAMIENNEVGRQVRRYFIRVEEELRAELRDRARHVLDLPGVKSFRRGISFKQTVILQKQSRDLMQLIAAEPWAPARQNLHRQLRQVNDALGIPTDPLDEIAGGLLTHREG